MRRAVQQGQGQLVIEEIPAPEPGPGQILIDIAYCGICGSDLHFFSNEHAPSGNVLGHEWSGTVSQLGTGVEEVAVGDAVTMFGTPMSLVPEDLPPPSGDFAGLLGYHPVAHAGGYSDTLLYEAGSVRRLPEGVSLREGAMTDTLGVGLAAVRRVGVEIGASVLVIGAGPIGLVTLMAARLAGAGQVVVTDMSETRRAAARKHGADLVLDPAEVDVQEQIMSLTGGVGMDVVFECAGVPSTVQESVNLVKRSGRVGLVGVCFEPAQIMPAIWYIKDVTVIVVPGADLLTALDVMARKQVDVTSLISHVVPLDEIQQSFEALLRPTDQLKVLVRP